MSRLGRALMAVVGAAAGLVVVASIPGDDDTTHDSTSIPTPTRTPADQPPVTSPPSGTDPSTNTLLVWTSGGLPDGLDASVVSIDQVTVVSSVWGDTVDLVSSIRSDGTPVETHDNGWAIPLDAIAIDPRLHAHFVDPASADQLGLLEPGAALLTETSARLRDLDVGGRLTLRTGTVEVVGIIDDVAGAGAELIAHRADVARTAIQTPRYLLVGHRGSRESVQAAIADALVDPRPVRFRTPAETTWLRHGDAVMPQAIVKDLYGEFAYRTRDDASLEVDAGWLESNIVERDVPILGTVRCHHRMIDALTVALGRLVADGLAHLVDPDDYAGCHVARRIEQGGALSRHTWGIAIDLNVSGNPRGTFSSQDPALVDTMRTAGFTWGGTWLVPDPAHYELLD